jgi:hypothetical protein
VYRNGNEHLLTLRAPHLSCSLVSALGNRAPLGIEEVPGGDAVRLKAEKGERTEKHLLITRFDSARAARGEMLAIEDVLEILSVPLWSAGTLPWTQRSSRSRWIAVPSSRSAAGMSRSSCSWIIAVLAALGATDRICRAAPGCPP